MSLLAPQDLRGPPCWSKTDSSRDGITGHTVQAKGGQQQQQTPEGPCLPSPSLAPYPLHSPFPVRHFFPPFPSSLGHPISQSLSSPVFSNLVDVDDVVSLSYGNLSGIRRKSHALHHIALPAILRVKKEEKKIRKKRTEKRSNEYTEKRRKGACVMVVGLRALY